MTLSVFLPYTLHLTLRARKLDRERVVAREAWPRLRYKLSAIMAAAVSSNVENLSPQIIRRVAKEMAELVAQPPEGIRVILNEADVTDIQAVIEGP